MDGVNISVFQRLAEVELPVGVSRFWSRSFFGFIFGFGQPPFCRIGDFSDNKWQKWSIWGSAFILFNIWFWRAGECCDQCLNGSFWDMIKRC